jgi:hypothetical protein
MIRRLPSRTYSFLSDMFFPLLPHTVYRENGTNGQLSREIFVHATNLLATFYTYSVYWGEDRN